MHFLMVANFKKNQKSNSKGKRFLIYAGAIFILFILAVLIIGNIRIYQKRQEFLVQVASLENQIKDMENRNNNLKQGISKTNDGQYIEKIAREELDLQKPGETAVSFVVPEDESQDANVRPNSVGGWFKNIWNWITGKK